MKKGFAALIIIGLILIVFIVLGTFLYIKNSHKQLSTKSTQSLETKQTALGNSNQPNDYLIKNPTNNSPDRMVLQSFDSKAPYGHQFKILFYQTNGDFIASCEGGGEVISPDGKKILSKGSRIYNSTNVYQNSDFNVHLIGDECKVNSVLTSEGMVGTKDYTYVTAKPLAWSPDSQKFIYSVQSEIPGGDGTYIWGTKINPTANEGLFLYDLATQKSQKILSKEDFQKCTFYSWPQNYKYPVFVKEFNVGLYENENLNVLDFSKKICIQISSKSFPYLTQIGFGANGLITFPEDHSDGSARIILSNIDGRNETSVSPNNASNLYQWPKFNNDSTRIRYYNQTNTGRLNTLFIYDIKTGQTQQIQNETGIKSQWLNSDQILVSESNFTYVLDLTTGNKRKIADEAYILSPSP